MNDCQECGGTGLIYRPVKTITKQVVDMIDGEHVERTVTDKVGGIDACPTCAAHAEAEYQYFYGE